MSTDVSNFISNLKELANKDKVLITVPSVNKKVAFKPLSVKQQKDALRASLAGVQGSVLFFNSLNTIIEENCEENIDFTIQDRAYIILQLRNNALGTAYKKRDKVYDLNVTFVKLEQKNAYNVEYSGIGVTLEVPSLKKDTQINNKCSQEIKNKQAEEVGSVIDVLYAYEIIKFIKEITFNDEVIDFVSLPFKDKRAAVDTFPLGLNRLILQEITKIKSYDDNYLSVDGDELTLDVSLLTND